MTMHTKAGSQKKWDLKAPFLALAGGLMVTGCIHPSTTSPDSALHAGDRYVALGSSYAAGPNLGPAQPGSPKRCGRTQANYATLLAQKLNLKLVDASCGGAQTKDLLHPWKELPAQLDAVTAGTRLVTVTVGGNDINFVGELFAASCRAGALGDGDTSKCAPRKPLASEEQYAALEKSMLAIANTVHQKAPKAKLVFVDYVSVVPSKSCAAAPILPEDQAPLTQMGKRLAAITAKVAKESGAMFVDAGAMSKDHDPCDPAPWAHGMNQDFDDSQGAPWHPTRLAMQDIADALASRLKR
ncbi:SGNH/GDSL hydrolase family protein [Altererythrobacter indicus]|uniref:SGNH/GDSL hydrolase family protein n=1 Tax=Altericroceibacterium indicum TaxID=374177 RepID=A0A845AC54_9SPHN|nr:SGNH/GDSL hydrolase family protein [Altericroceibacterium indicum]MXP24758.1 SGNH/GDSL hydrolase family protein [Altericroceibacterium indicum]